MRPARPLTQAASMPLSHLWVRRTLPVRLYPVRDMFPFYRPGRAQILDSGLAGHLSLAREDCRAPRSTGHLSLISSCRTSLLCYEPAGKSVSFLLDMGATYSVLAEYSGLLLGFSFSL